MTARARKVASVTTHRFKVGEVVEITDPWPPLMKDGKLIDAGPKLVLVEWLDSAQPLAAWRHLDDLPSVEAVHCRSVGWLVAETDEVKMLAPNLAGVPSEDSAQGSGFIRIPARCIVGITELVEK